MISGYQEVKLNLLYDLGSLMI